MGIGSPPKPITGSGSGAGLCGFGPRVPSGLVGPIVSPAIAVGSGALGFCFSRAMERIVGAYDAAALGTHGGKSPAVVGDRNAPNLLRPKQRVRGAFDSSLP